MVISQTPKTFVFTRQRLPVLRILFFLLLSVCLIIADSRFQRVDYLRRGLTLVLTPFHYVVSGPSHLFDVIKSSMTSHQQLVEENRNLRMQQLFLQSQLSRYSALEKENEQLRELLLASRDIDGKVLNARLLAVAPDPYLSEIMINKGAKDNVYVGQPVLDSYGVMGQVTRVGPFTSSVLLINDNRSLVPVEVHRNGLRGIAAGKGHAKMQLLYVPDTADVRVGDQLLTSGLGQRYPAGYPVAEVTEIQQSPENQFALITLRPIALLHQSREVLLIWPGQAKETL